MSKPEKLKVETWPIEKLVPYARNPRKNDHVVDKVAGFIREFGWRQPILVKSDGTIIDGHLRLKAAQKLELKDIPVHIVDNLTEAQIKALRIEMNKSAELADWDTELLKLELDELKDMDFDLELTGFDAGELTEVMYGKILDDDNSNKEVEYKEQIEVVVTCNSENEQENLYNELSSRGFKCRVQSL